MQTPSPTQTPAAGCATCLDFAQLQTAVAAARERFARIREKYPQLKGYLVFCLPGKQTGITTSAVHPILLFYQDYFTCFQFRTDDPTEYPEFNESPLYLLGWCQTRQAARYFRLDRMEI